MAAAVPARFEVETKSGTNKFHGDAYEFQTATRITNARNYFAPDRASYKKNDFGYTIGGPVFISGRVQQEQGQHFLFSGRKNGRRDRVPGQVFNVPVPTVPERNGDFSDLCPTAGTDFYRDSNLAPANAPVFPDCPSIGPGAASNTFATFSWQYRDNQCG